MVKTYDYCSLKDGRKVSAYEIINKYGESAVIINYGAAVAQLNIMDKNGRISDVVLGPDRGQDVSEAKYLGSVKGRCANRIAHASFKICDKEYHLTPRELGNHLHGAEGCWAKQFFEAEIGDNSVVLRHYDDGRDGWECGAEAEITYSFDDNHALCIDYKVKALGDTVISPTNHAYFNLNSPLDISDTELKIFTDSYAPKSKLRMPDGSVEGVKGTPLDFTKFRSFGDALSHDSEQFFPEYQSAFDDFYLFPGSGFQQLAEARDQKSGRIMRVFSDAQCLILYTPTVNETVINKGGKSYSGRLAFCLETQYVPNAVNCPEYRSPVFKSGEEMHSKTIYAFDII